MNLIAMASKQKIKLSSLIIPVVSIFTIYNDAYAENKAEVLETGNIEVISSTPLPSLGTPISEVPANVQSSTSKEITQQESLNLSDFLDSNLGSVNTSNSVGNPYQSDVSYRGFTASPILGTAVGMSVFLDGVRFNEPFGDIVNWDLIPANAISNISLIPGSNPLFGLNTLGGALAVNTKSGSDYPGIKASVYTGSWGRHAFEFEAGGEDKSHGIDYFVAGNFFHEDGWRDNSASDVNQLFSKVGWHNDTSDLDLALALADNKMEGTQSLPLSMLSNPKQGYTYPDHITNELGMISLKGSHFITDEELVAGNIYYRRSNSNGFNSNASYDNDPTSPTYTQILASNATSVTQQNGFGAALQISLLKDIMGHRNNFTLGGSIDYGRVNYSSATYGATLVGQQTITLDPSDPNYLQDSVVLRTISDYYGLFATDDFAFNDQWNLTLSGRYNLAQIHLSGTNSVPGDLNGAHQYNRFNPAVGLNYNPSKNLGLYAAYNEGMRAPTPVELSCADQTVPCSLPTGFNSDPNLNMVVAKTWEGGLRGVFAGNIHWNASLYNTETTNDIQFISAGGNSTYGFFQNVGTTQRRGIELGLNGKFDKLSLAANYGFVDATYQSDFLASASANSQADANGNINVTKGDRIPGIARQTFKVRAAYDLSDQWNVGSNLIVASGQYPHGDENNQDINGKIPGYAVLNLDTHYSLNRNWKLFAKVNNVFDKDYATFGTLGLNLFNVMNEQFRTPAAPRAAWVGVTYEFGVSGKADPQVDKD